MSLHVLQPTTAHDVDSHDQFLSALEHEVTRARTFGRGATHAVLEGRNLGDKARLKALTARLRADESARWADDGNRNLTVFFDKPLDGEHTLSLHGEIPAPRQLPSIFLQDAVL